MVLVCWVKEVKLYRYLVLYRIALTDKQKLMLGQFPRFERDVFLVKGLECTDLVLTTTLLNKTLDRGIPFERYRDRVFNVILVNHRHDIFTEESTIHRCFNDRLRPCFMCFLNALTNKSQCFNGVMTIATSMMNSQYLCCLSDRAVQRIVASLALFLSIEPNSYTFCMSAGAQYWTIKVQCHSGLLFMGDCLQHHALLQLLDIANISIVQITQLAANRRHIVSLRLARVNLT